MPKDRAALALIGCSLMLTWWQPVTATAEMMEPEKITEMIQQAKILPQTCKLITVVNGNEAIVSTYRSQDQLTVNDCKIDAVQIAKILMVDRDTGIRRLKVQFHDPNLVDDFREISVSSAAIKGFAAGAVGETEFLESLTVLAVPEVKSPPPVSAAATSTAPPHTASAGTSSADATPANNSATSSTPASTKVQPPSPKTRFVSRMHGVSFDVPAGWQLEEGTTINRVFKLIDKRTKLDNISLSFTSGGSQTPAACAIVERQRFNYPEAHKERYESTRFGKGQYPGVLTVFSYPNWNDNGTRYYEMKLWFGRPGALYELRGWSNEWSYSRIAPVFFDIMTSMSFPPVTAATRPKSPGKK